MTSNESTHSASPPADEAPVFSGGPTHKIRTGALVGIFILAVLYTAYFAAPILIPMALAFLFNLILSPAVGWLARLHIPYPIGAAMVLGILLIGFGAAVYGLSGPAEHWMKEAPHAVRKFERTFHHLKGPFHDIQKTVQQLDEISNDSANSVSRPRPVKIVGQDKGLIIRLFSFAPVILSDIGIVIVLLYFLLASGDSFLRSLTHVIAQWSRKKRVVEIVRNIQSQISGYLFTITLINLGVGLVNGIALFAIGMPNPVLWGVMIAIFNYVPYLGAATAIVVLTLIALITFNHIAIILLVPATVFAIAILEGQFITPRIVGRRLILSPVIIFVALVVWGWLWGIVGAIIAVPLLACFKIVCEEIEVLNPIAQFLTVYSLSGGRAASTESEVD